MRDIYGADVAYKCLRSFEYIETIFRELNLKDPKMIKEGGDYIANNIQFYKSNLKAFDTKKEKQDIESAKWIVENIEKFKTTDYNNQNTTDCDERRKKIHDRATKSYRSTVEQHVASILSLRKSRWSAFESFFVYNEKKPGMDRMEYYQREMFVDKKSVLRAGGILKILVYEIGEDMSLPLILHNRGTGERIYAVSIYELNCSKDMYRVIGPIELVEPIQAENVYKVHGLSQDSWGYSAPNTEVDKLFRIFCK